MAGRIVEAGFPTSLWARRQETLTPYAGSGATLAMSPADLGAASDVLCVCVVDDSDVDEVLRGDTGALSQMAPGSIVAVHSTVHPDTLLRLQADFPAITFVDAPVSGGGQRAETGQLLVMVGGPSEAVERCRPVFESYGNPVVHLGPLGAAQQAKLLNNALFTAQLGLVADVFDTARLRGLDPASLATVLADGSGRCYALDVLAGAGFQLSGMASIAGPLLAKDVGILAGVVSPAAAQLIAAADRALAGMGVDRTPISEEG
jgi:3-hydroxyisobutyrate dehydrogenase-like beta-hydroxyacid dehydrogenase